MCLITGFYTAGSQKRQLKTGCLLHQQVYQCKKFAVCNDYQLQNLKKSFLKKKRLRAKNNTAIHAPEYAIERV